MTLNEVWFILVTVLFIGFFFLEGFDFGVGMSTRLIARDAKERDQLINTIGPFWDANEVWLLTAGGAIFAAFPHWYATMFSGYYIPFVFFLLALIARGVGIEYSHHPINDKWKNVWHWFSRNTYHSTRCSSFLWRQKNTRTDERLGQRRTQFQGRHERKRRKGERRREII